MSETLRITIFDEDRRQVHSEEYAEPVELGRQDRNDGEVYSGRLKDGVMRIPLVAKTETAVSFKQVLVGALPGGWVRLSNQSTVVPIRLLEDRGGHELASELGPKSSRDVPLPVTLGIGPRTVRIGAAPARTEAVHLESLAARPLPPGAPTPDHSLLNTIAAERTIEGDQTPLIPWLQAMKDVQEATTPQDCYDRAAGALVNLIRLDAGAVLMFEGGDWVQKALKVAPQRAPQGGVNHEWKPSKQVLARLRKEKMTFWRPPPDGTESTFAVQALVAAPILDRQAEVIGVLYGDSSEWGGAGPFSSRPVTRQQVMLVQLLASGVAADGWSPEKAHAGGAGAGDWPRDPGRVLAEEPPWAAGLGARALLPSGPRGEWGFL